MTAAQAQSTFYELLEQSDENLYELVHGQLVEKKVGAVALWVAGQIVRLIGNHVAHLGGGWVMPELAINCFPWLQNHGRRPDVAYLDAERFPTLPKGPVGKAPDFVAEVLSPNDDAIEVDVKVEEYLRAGIKLVWVLNPETRTIRVHRSDRSVQMFHEADTITGESVLPEFRAVVREFFPVVDIQPQRP